MRFTPPVPLPNDLPRRGEYQIAGAGRAIATVSDAGAVTMYRPAVHRKPESMMRRFGRQIESIIGRPTPPSQTTQQGTSAASPSTYYQTLWPQRFEKAQYISDNYDQWYNDPACRKACNMYAFESVREGFKISVIGKGRFNKAAQDIADTYSKLWPVHGGPIDGVSLMGGALCALIQGEFWPQAALSGMGGSEARIDHFLTMPAVGMERNTDDADQFVDPSKAYSQVDTQTWANVADFPFWSTFCARWNWIPGSKNGNPEIISVRRLARLLELMEACKITQVQTRSGLKYLYQYGTPDMPASPDQVKDLMALNGFVEGKRSVYDPTEVARDIHMNGVGDVKVLEGDQHVGDVEHLRYFLDRYASGLPTPRALMNLGSENINRDVLRDMRAQWMADTLRMNGFLDGPIKFFFELSLLLQGIDPDEVQYEVTWTKSTIATEQEQIAGHIAMYEAGLESRQSALRNLSQYTHISDIEVELKMLEEEAEVRAEQEMQRVEREAGVKMAEKMKDKSAFEKTKTLGLNTTNRANKRATVLSEGFR